MYILIDSCLLTFSYIRSSIRPYNCVTRINHNFGSIQILQLLRGNSESLDIIMRIRKPSHWKRYYEELFIAEENKMTRGLSGLSLQEQIALEVSLR